jgi:hypothetical protein
MLGSVAIIRIDWFLYLGGFCRDRASTVFNIDQTFDI